MCTLRFVFNKNSFMNIFSRYRIIIFNLNVQCALYYIGATL